MKNLAKTLMKGMSRSVGVNIEKSRTIRDPFAHLLYKLDQYDVHTILDIGANTGQFVGTIRSYGFRGTVISFEPIKEAHAQLIEKSKLDTEWVVQEPMALGAENTQMTLNVSENLASSSILMPTEEVVRVEPRIATTQSEIISVKRLDAVMTKDNKRPLALKIDTQGFELEVLKGASGIVDDIKLILTEISLIPLYDGSPTFLEILEWMRDNGYRCIGITQGFADNDTAELLQVDGLFVKD